MKISELKPKVGNISLEFEVIEKGDIREFNKFGKSGRVCNAVVKDDTGKVKLTLWNDETEKINVGDKVRLTDGWTGEYQGEIQLSTGRAGKLEIISKSSAKPQEKKSEEKPAPSSIKTPQQLEQEEDEPDDEESGEDDSFDVDEEYVE